MRSQEIYQNRMLEYRPDPPAMTKITLDNLFDGMSQENKHQVRLVFEALEGCYQRGDWEVQERFLSEYSDNLFGDKRLTLLFHQYVQLCSEVE